MIFRTFSLVVVAASLVASGAPAQSLTGYRYGLRMESGSDDEFLAQVSDAGDRARLDFNAADRSYLLILDHGKRMVTVHPRHREYNEVADTSLERVIGRALHAVSRTGIVRLRVQDAEIRTRLVGPGGTVAGRPTQHYRLTQDFTVSVSALGLAGDDVHQVVITDYWVDPALRLVRNPLLDLLASTESALAQEDRDFRTRSATAREEIFTGVPLRVVVTSMEGDLGRVKKSRVIEVDDLARDSFDPAIFEIPAGYERRRGEGLDLGLRSHR